MKFLTPLLVVVVVISLLGNVLIYERFNTRKPIITVGDDPISLYRYNTAMETTPTGQTTFGAATLKKIVYSDLVRQAAAKANVMPTEADLDARIKELQMRSPQAVAPLSSPDPGVVKGFRDDLKSDIALENLRIQGVSASDAEISAFYNRNPGLFTIPSQVQTTMVVSQRQSDATRAEHLLTQGVKPEIIAGQPGLRVAGVNANVDIGKLPPAISQQIGRTVLAMKDGQIKTLALPGSIFLTFKVKGSHGNELQPLGQVKEQVARQVKLQKAISPQQELGMLYKENTPVFNVSRYAADFSDIQQFNAQNVSKTASAR